MSNKRQEGISQLIAEGGTFMMVAGEASTSNGISKQIAAGVQFIYVVDACTISVLEETTVTGSAVSVLGDGTDVLGQRVSGIQLPAGTFLKATTQGGFTKITLSGTPSTGKIICTRKTPQAY